MSDVLEVRCALDVLAVELACGRITRDEVEELNEACRAFEKATESKDVHVIAKADVAFHDIIFKAAGNPRLTQMINNLAEQMYRYRFEYIKDESQHVMLVKEHRQICDSIEKRDVEAAKDAIRQHIENQEKSIIRQIRLEKK
jgi:DNA-binding GntR family transcriptional regulator